MITFFQIYYKQIKSAEGADNISINSVHMESLCSVCPVLNELTQNVKQKKEK